LTRGLKATVSSVAIALAITGVGAVGTAYAATPADSGGASVIAQDRPHQPPPPPHRFRQRFRSQQECRARADRDHRGRPSDWDCRRGPNRNDPWEYWGR
jgi:hypothetical protein